VQARSQAGTVSVLNLIPIAGRSHRLPASYMLAGKHLEEILSPQAMNIIGLVANAVGVILLFMFGMPFRVASTKGELLRTSIVRPDEKRTDDLYKWLGYLGLALILAGAVLQIGATLNA
jgi:hypothetical protein